MWRSRERQTKGGYPQLMHCPLPLGLQVRFSRTSPLTQDAAHSAVPHSPQAMPDMLGTKPMKV